MKKNSELPCFNRKAHKKHESTTKLNSMLLFMLIFLCYTTAVFAQSPKLSLEVNNTTVEDAIEKIEKSTPFRFVFTDKTVDTSRKVSIKVNNGEITDVVNQLVRNTDITYKIVDRQIILSKKEAVSTQPLKRITGTVTDTNNEPIIGAAIQEKGTSNGTVTNIDGAFTLEVGENAALTVSFLGYTTQELVVKSQNNFNIILRDDLQMLNEVVVVGYGVQDKKTLTGAVSVMKMDEIEASTRTTVSHSMAGKAAGLRVNQVSAQAGGGAKFRIRGEASINASNDPLIVIDGFPVSSGGSLGSGNIYDAGSTDNVLESLNPDDIESISVLKDAASTAIYGARAGHGVILITTKRGKAQKARVNYSGNVSIQRINNNYDMLNAKGYMDMRNKQLYEEYLKANALGIYKDYITLPDDHKTVPFKPMYTNDQINLIKGTDWLDKVTRGGFMHQHNISINGGTETTRLMTSINYMSQEGVVKKNAAERFSIRLNLDQDINKFLSVGLTATYTQNKYDNVPLGDGQNEYSGVLTAAIQANPVIPIYDDKGNYYIDPYRPFVPNPVSILDITDKTVKDRILATGFVSAKPVEGLELKFQLGADRKFQKRSNYLPKTTLEGQKHNGAANISREDGTDYLMDLTADYTRTFSGHKVKALAGYSFQQFNGEGSESGNRDFLTDGFLYYNIGAGSYEKPIVGSWGWKNSIASYFARIHYSYMDKYLFEGTIRADGASNFTSDNRWGYFPSVSAGWVISEERFMEKTRSWLSNLKLRASFGQTGNSSVGYRIQDFFSVGRHAIFGESQYESPGVFASELGNAKLTWETTTEVNVGIDMGLWNNRIRLTAEYFNRRISDLLSTKSLLSYNEVDRIYANIGKTKSDGYELTLNTNWFATGTFEWNTTFTLSHYNDRWSKRDPDWKPKPYQKDNDAIRAWWTYEAVGIMRPGDAAPKAQADLLPGQVILKDQNNDGVINEEDMVYMGNGDPKLIFGLNNTFKYKNFDLNIYFYGETDRKRGASYKEDWTRMDNGQNVSVMSYKSFNSNNIYSNHPTYIRSGAYGWGDYYVKSISYIRCGNITLGYRVPVGKKAVQSLRVFADVNNPFVITNWKGLDPETDNGSFAYPNIRSYNLGLNVTF